MSVADAVGWACGSVAIGIFAGWLLRLAMRGKSGVWVLSNQPKPHRCRKPGLLYAPWRRVGQRWRCLTCEQEWVITWDPGLADRDWMTAEQALKGIAPGQWSGEYETVRFHQRYAAIWRDQLPALGYQFVVRDGEHEVWSRSKAPVA